MKKHEYEFFDENYGKLYEATYFAKESRKDNSLLENHPERVVNRQALEKKSNDLFEKAIKMILEALVGFGLEKNRELGVLAKKTAQDIYRSKTSGSNPTKNIGATTEQFRKSLIKRDNIARAQFDLDIKNDEFAKKSAPDIEGEEFGGIVKVSGDYSFEEQDDPRTWPKNED